jgi:uncharacterized protein (DUF4213/DUF364 family)
MLYDDYHALGTALAEALPPLGVRSMFLPPLPEPGDRGDCFAFLFLSDGSAGPFYVSLGNSLARLVERYPDGGIPAESPRELLDGFISSDPMDRALALGAFNAMSQSLMRRAGFVPPRVPPDADPAPGETVGMVGFFGRLARPWSAAGVRIKVLELAPERVEPLPGVSVTSDAGGLEDCSRIVCTSSVLVNQTLDDIISAVGDPSRIDLVGPSGSGLPDIPLARGVRSVGGTFFPDAEALLATLDAGGRWGGSGRKYRITGACYPGFQALAASLPASS